tara:strand:- start:261 stop:650 length:390 start_codon:yes stop_codon:yes gene_type:complete
MGATNNFRRNFRKILKDQRFTLAAFAEKVDMDVSKIQRLQDIKQDGAVTLEDADTISTALNTTLGYMCGNAYTDYMLDQTKMMRDYFARNVDRRDLYFEAMAADRSREKEILDYLDEILDSVDSLHKRT